MENVYRILIIICIAVLAVLIVLTLVHTIRGKSITERTVPVNMAGTMAVVIMLMLSILLGETGVLDTALLYSMLSFLAVVVLSKVYIGVDKERKLKRNEENGEGDENK